MFTSLKHGPSPLIPQQFILSIIESTGSKGSRRSSSSATPRKLSQISQEELASKTTLSHQYLKEDQNKKPGQPSKVNGVLSSSETNIATPTGRSGIPGQFMKRISVVHVNFCA